ncbi:hypothetical protein [Streptomyces aidingensis]|uniref:Uncharacterized protein n=1 Tax=Streptomyces aidingensis TaxID=910347 RepID=A0A1I1EEK5_9ACTN|nr:hypothetical protein [Streptomyces aidingensis]SFB85012.1 hypothetical protein SAMN05421773_101253 [Streptomyces aidingensis]
MNALRAATDEALGVVPFAGHLFRLRADPGFRLTQMQHLLDFAPRTRPAPPCLCAEATVVRVHRSGELFRDATARLSRAPALPVAPLADARCLRATLGETTWWRPARDGGGRGVAPDHLYARDAAGTLHIVLDTRARHGERHLLHVIGSVTARCAEHRGWVLFEAAAAAVADQGVLIVGTSPRETAIVLRALVDGLRAEPVGYGRTAVTPDGRGLIGLPLPLSLPVPPQTPGPGLRETAPLRLLLLVRRSAAAPDNRPPETAPLPLPRARAMLAAACRTPDGGWLFPRTWPEQHLRHRAHALLDSLPHTVLALALALSGDAQPAALDSRITDAVLTALAS